MLFTQDGEILPKAVALNTIWGDANISLAEVRMCTLPIYEKLF